MTSQPQNNEHFEELASAYVLGALSSDERKEFEALLNSASEERRAIYSGLAFAGLMLPGAAKSATPSPSVKSNLMAAIQADAKPAESSTVYQFDQNREATVTRLARSMGFGRPAFSFAVAATLMLALMMGAVILNNLYTTSIEQNERLARLESVLEQKSEMLSVLETPQIQVVNLEGMDACP